VTINQYTPAKLLECQKKCDKCGSPCELKWNSGDPKYVCTKEDCRKIQDYNK